jgi:hypothetical protein
VTARRRLTPSVLASAALSLGLGACATTYDASVATVADATTTTSTLPTGTTPELLRQLVTEANGLSGLMATGGDAADQAARIAQLWAASRTEVGATRPDLLADFLANVAKCGTAVQFKRAADADKAAKNLTILVKAYLGA